MDVTNSETAELFAQIHEQEHENGALEKMQHELQVRLDEDEKCIVGNLAILWKQLHDEVERAKNLKGNISSLQIKTKAPGAGAYD